MDAYPPGQSPDLVSTSPFPFSKRFDQVKKFLIILLILSPIILSVGCTTIHHPVPLKQISLSEAENIISGIREQGDNVGSFYTLGVVSIKGWILDSDADILVAGEKDPFMMKIEITHSWGTPVLHILIKDGIFNVLSYQEKTLYTGAFTAEALSRFLSGFELNREMIWSILSGRPPVAHHDVIKVSSPDMINLSDKNGIELEVVYLPIEGSFPKKVDFPEQSLNIFFSDQKEDGGIPYAGQIKLSGEKLERDLTLIIKKISLNASIPDKIFALEKPSNYGTVNLDDLP